MTRAYAHLIAFFTVAGLRLEDRKERGATAVEYGLLVGLIAIVMITGVALVGPRLSAMFTAVAGRL